VGFSLLPDAFADFKIDIFQTSHLKISVAGAVAKIERYFWLVLVNI
jgi:hypothetical protein